MKNREQVRVWVSAEAKDELERVAKLIGIKQIDLLSRMCEWFAASEKTEQLRVLGILKKDEQVGPAAPNTLTQRPAHAERRPA